MESEFDRNQREEDRASDLDDANEEMKNKTLSEKLKGRDIDGFVVKDVKEKIQNAERRLKEDIDRRWNGEGDLIDFNDRDIKKEIKKIFSEEFGDLR